MTSNALATTVWFEWGTNSTLSTYSSTPTVSAGSGATSVETTSALSGLSTGTSYYYRIAASNVTGTNKGSILNFVTTGSTPPGSWTKLFGSTGDDRANGVVTDNNGNIYIVGEINGVMSGTIGFDEGADAFVRKYDSNFNMLWSKSEGLKGINSGRGVALDSVGNIFMTGHLSDDNSALSIWDYYFISKYDGNGNKLWGDVSTELGTGAY